MEKLKIKNSTMAKVTSTKIIEKNLVEPIPMRQALINAIVHSDLSGEMSIFKISEHFIKVEFPFSVPKDISSADDNNVSNVSDNNAEHRVLEFLHQEPTATGRGIAAELGISDRQVWRILKKLRENGIVLRIGTTRNGYWKVKEKDL